MTPRGMGSGRAARGTARARQEWKPSRGSSPRASSGEPSVLASSTNSASSRSGPRSCSRSESRQAGRNRP